MQVGYDVVVVGAGPVGMTTACTLKAIHNDLRICVIDKRPDPQRNHGLKIKSDSINKIQALLQQVLNTGCEYGNSQSITELKFIFEEWRNNFIRTNQIEKDLTAVAKNMGIDVIRDKICEISEKNFTFLCTNSEFNDDESICSNELKAIFKNARIIIGADGAHSIVRKVVMGDIFSHQETLRHLVELKYQTLGQMPNRGFKEASRDVIKHRALSFETTSNDNKNPTKPVTYHLSVTKQEYDSLRITVDEKLKGVFGNSWTVAELEELAKIDIKVNHVYAQISNYLKEISLRNGECKNEKISTLSLSIYRSKEIVKKFQDKYVLLVGDAESGLILERGFNKGIICSGICAKIVSQFFQEKQFSDEQLQLPQLFQDYEKSLLAIFENERRWANVKNFSLNAVESSLNPTRKFSETYKFFSDESKKITSSHPSQWASLISTKVIESDTSRIVSDTSMLIVEEVSSTSPSSCTLL